jgi:hypothetical protein
MKDRYQFIHFVELPAFHNRPRYSCQNNKSGEELGHVAWYSPWRQYCYFPTAQAVYSTGCLTDINDFINQLGAGK